jgi:hypothetical protein
MIKRAELIMAAHNSLPAIRVVAQRECAAMKRDHRKSRDVYMFTDGSRLIVTLTTVSVEFTSRIGI